MRPDADPLDVQSGDIEALRRLLPRVAVAYARAGEARASDDFLAGFIRGLARRPVVTRRRRLAVAVLVAAAFLAGLILSPRGSAATSEALRQASIDVAAPAAPSLVPGAPPVVVASGQLPSATGGAPPTAEIGKPASYFKPTPRPRIVPRGTSDGIPGEATWWATFGGGYYAAIRPDLGRKGDLAVVCGGSPFHCLTVPIITTCACLGPNSDRLIDLSIDAFSSFADPSAGVVRITLQVVGR